ncbi:MAG: PepSY domain-containing protein [Lachnospiraceae bacterium]|nr:PepSY domain-containing protein [Lachnospiraceae bacterium]
MEYRTLKNTLSTSAAATTSITLDEAKEIALADTGLTDEEIALVTFTKEKTDYDDGLSVYELEFSSEDKAYEYEISTATGDILSTTEKVITVTGADTLSSNTAASDAADANSQNADTGSTDTAATGSNGADTGSAGTATTNSNEADTGVSLDEAKAIALERAGLSASEVTFKKAKLDKDDGIMVYEIEFYQGQMEYECEINASTGAIIEFDAEWDD